MWALIKKYRDMIASKRALTCKTNEKNIVLILTGNIPTAEAGLMFIKFKTSAFARSYCLALVKNSLMLSFV